MNESPARRLSLTLATPRKAVHDTTCEECGAEFAVGPIARCPHCSSRQLRSLDPLVAALRRSVLVMSEAANELRVLDRADLVRTLEIRIEQAEEALKSQATGA